VSKPFPLLAERPLGGEGEGCWSTSGCSSLLTFLEGGGGGSRATSAKDSTAKQQDNKSGVREPQNVKTLNQQKAR